MDLLDRARVRRLWLEDPEHGLRPPHRGDLVYTNVGKKLERTWMVLRTTPMKPRRETGLPRHRVWMARWWELLPATRMRLYNSARRNGGQRVMFFHPFPPKKKRTFEQHMRRRLRPWI